MFMVSNLEYIHVCDEKLKVLSCMYFGIKKFNFGFGFGTLTNIACWSQNIWAHLTEPVWYYMLLPCFLVLYYLLKIRWIYLNTSMVDSFEHFWSESTFEVLKTSIVEPFEHFIVWKIFGWNHLNTSLAEKINGETIWTQVLEPSEHFSAWTI